MKAAVLTQSSGFKIIERPMPELIKGWAIIQVHAAGICGSDMHFYTGELTPPVPDSIRGHEISGRIFDPGGTDLSEGQAVIVHPLLGCGKCPACMRGEGQLCAELHAIGGDHPGGFAEFVVVPATNIYPFDSELLTFTEAVFADCVAVCVHTANKVGLHTGESVAVMGDGTIGLLLAQVARYRGADPVFLFGKHDRNIMLAKELGTSHVQNVQEHDPIVTIRDELGTVDIVFEAAGGKAPPIHQGLSMLRKGGRLAMLGFTGETCIPVPWLDMVIGELSVSGVMGYGKFDGKDEMQEALDMMERRQLSLDPLITHSYSLEQIGEGFDAMLNREESEAIKVVILFHHEDN